MNLIKSYLIALTIWIPTVLGLYHELSMQTFRENLTEGAYFGYSITYQPLNKRLIVSAPKNGNIGEIYSCNIDSKICSKIANSIFREGIKIENNFLLGASVKAGSSFTIACAPLYIKNYNYARRVNRSGTFGQCYVQADNSSQLEVLSSIDDTIREHNTRTFERAMDSFGWSIDVAPDDSVLVGSPAMFTGRVMKYESLSDVPIGISGYGVGEKYNFGYSIVSGYFFNAGALIHAISSPYRKGNIKFFDESLKHLKRKFTKGVDDDVVGSLYGAAMCSASITEKGRNDLLVGAPAYGHNGLHDVGAVYVYSPFSTSNISFKRKIIGRKAGSYFGSAIVTVGDLNGDFMDEIAIAAPYEDEGQGTVYLYSGYDIIDVKTNLIQEVQKIQSEEYRAFGMSLTALNDYDENGCNELAIGSPGNNKVALLRCMAAVKVVMYAVFPDLKLRKNETHSYNIKNETYFVFKSCMDIEYPSKLKEINGNIQVKVEMNYLSETLAKPRTDDIYNVTLYKKEKKICRDIEVLLPDFTTSGSQEIGYKISASHLDSPIHNIDFNPARVVLSDRSVLSIQDSVWVTECNVNEACLPEVGIQEIVTDMPYINGSYQHVIGSKESQNIGIVISNTGEIAYSWCVRVRTVGATVMRLPQPPNMCEYIGTERYEIKCSSQQRLKTNHEWFTDPISIDMTSLTSNNKEILVYFDLYNNCKVNATAESRMITMHLESDTDGIIIEGEAMNGENGTVAITYTEAKVEGKELGHIYRVKNSVTNWVGGIKCTLVIEKKSYIQYIGLPALHYKNSDYECVTQSENDNALSWMCSLDTFDRKLEFTIAVPMALEPNELLGEKIKIENLTVDTKLIVNFNGVFKSHKIKVTLALLPDATIPLWIIILAVLFGLLLLVIIGIVFWKCGFLKRKNKENLQRVQRSVHRQSMRRSRNATDTQKLLKADHKNGTETVNEFEDNETQEQEI